ncbi:BatA domain-containing protein [Fulvivirga sp. 29W222]|uniref:BatA domain-containing protein n=1 Tax=Fulvivirga marina TaxID=2494733 RepID=A0A937G126_9BACT|nr:BatA domain-containing protein [Fulvivirga marina]MBL6448035.1 BatA domain-containing protein [Fulvivirga marina]
MNFLYPQFLYALFALSIPIIIHLFNFRKTKKVYFSNTRFLQKVKEASSSKRKLKHYLILASRLLMLFFLVIAFAQPFFPSEEEASAQGKTLIYIDNSLSMNNEVDEGVAAFDEAMQYVNTLTELYPTSVEYKVLTNDFNTYSGIYQNRKEVSELTTELRMTGVTRSFEDIKERLSLQKDDGTYDVFWISDFQVSTAGKEEEIHFDSTYSVNLVPMNFTSVNNVYVDSLYLDNPFLIGDEKLKLNVVLKNIGEKEASDLIVKVYVDEVQSATASVNIKPNDIVTATFDLAFNIEGNNKCRISFEEFPVTFDNDFYFTINGSQKIDVLEIKSKSEVIHVQSVFGNEELFNLKSTNYSNLDYSLIPEADLVVVNGLENIDPSLAVVLNEYLAEYGNVIFIPASSPDIASYRQLSGLGNLTHMDSVGKVALMTPDFKDPFFENVFEETNKSFAMPEATGVVQWGRDRTALLKYNNGMPFLSKMGVNGNLYAFGSPLNTNYTSLHAHAIFVPIMYRIAAQSASKESKLYYFIDDPRITFKTDTLITDNIFKLKRGDEEIIPSQHIVGNNVFMEVPKFTLGVGFYELVFEGKKLTTLAFNASPAESDLRQYLTEDLKNTFKGKVEVFEVQDEEGFKRSVEKKYIGQPLWKYAIIIALIFLLMEVLLIRFLP